MTHCYVCIYKFYKLIKVFLRPSLVAALKLCMALVANAICCYYCTECLKQVVMSETRTILVSCGLHNYLDQRRVMKSTDIEARLAPMVSSSTVEAGRTPDPSVVGLA